MTKTLRTVATGASLLITALSLAWNGHGHQQVADIAWAKLSRAAKVDIALILGAADTTTGKDFRTGEPRTVKFGIDLPVTITDDFLEKTVRPAFRLASTWPDEIKSNKSSLFESRIEELNTKFPGVNPPAGDHVGARGEEVRMKTWHYFDKPVLDKTGKKVARPSNALVGLNWLRGDLEAATKSKDRPMQAFDLGWIEHLYGDLHQPLHTSQSFAVHADEGDAGGNLFKMKDPLHPDRTMNLHSYWDAGIDHAIAADARLANASFEDVTAAWTKDKDRPSKKDADNQRVESWIDDGAALSTNVVYGFDEGTAPGADYVRKHDEVCKRQALLAGYRLANYLNRILR